MTRNFDEHVAVVRADGRPSQRTTYAVHWRQQQQDNSDSIHSDNDEFFPKKKQNETPKDGEGARDKVNEINNDVWMKLLISKFQFSVATQCISQPNAFISSIRLMCAMIVLGICFG